MITLYDKDNKPTEVPEHEAAQRIAEGYGYTADTQIPVKFGDQAGTVPASHIQQALKDGATVVTPETSKPVTPERVLRGIASTTLGAARGFTGGGSDKDVLNVAGAVGGTALEGEYRGKLNELREEDPTGKVSEFVGALAPAFMSGGGSVAAKALTGGAEKVAATGLESVAKTGLEEGLANAPRVVEQVAPTLTEAAAPTLETAGKEALGASGVGRVAGVVSEAAPSAIAEEAAPLVEKGVTKALGAEGRSLLSKVLSEGGKGALTGAGEGAAYGAQDELTEQRLGGGPINGEKVLAAAGYGALFGGVTGGVLGGGSPLFKRVGGELAGKVSHAGVDEAFKALVGGRNVRGVRAAERVQGGTRGLGRFALDEGIIAAGDNVEDIARKSSGVLEKKTAALAGIRQAADDAGLHGPTIEAISKNIDANVTRELKKLPEVNAGLLQEVDRWKADLATNAVDGRLTFQDAADLRRRIDSKINWADMSAKEANVARKGIRRAVEGETETALDLAAKKLEKSGGMSLADYKAAKLDYAKALNVDNLATDAVSRRQANRSMSPSDYGTGLAFIADGHPLGGLAASLAHHVLRERGNSTAAVILDKVAALGLIRDAKNKVDRNISRGVGHIFGDNVAPIRVHEKINAGSAAHQDRIDSVVNTLSADHSNAVQGAAAQLATHAPETALGLQQAAVRASTFLRSLLPVDSQDPNIQPHLRNVADDMNSSQRASFERSYHAVNDPVGTVLPRIKDGSVCPDEIEAFKQVHPALYEQCVDEITAKLADTTKSLPGPTRFALSMFVGDPSLAGPTYTPQYLATMQHSYATPQAPPSSGKAPRAKAPKLGDLSGITQREQLGGATAKDFKL